MFILRTIKKGKATQNLLLGEYYSVIKKSSNPEDCKAFLGNQEHPMESFFGYLTYRNSKSNTDGHIELHDNEDYYIMTDSGKTFERIESKPV